MADIITSTHAVKNNTPPIGVIAPKILIPDKAKANKLPEKNTIPAYHKYFIAKIVADNEKI